MFYHVLSKPNGRKAPIAEFMDYYIASIIVDVTQTNRMEASSFVFLKVFRTKEGDGNEAK